MRESMASWSLQCIVYALLVLCMPPSGHGRRSKGRRVRAQEPGARGNDPTRQSAWPVSDFVSRWFARGAGAQMPGNDVPGVYPLFELEPNSDRDVMFSDGHASRIQHLGGHGNDGPPARAFHIRGFLREEEAAELIAEAQARPGGPQLSGTERGKAGAELWRNSEQVWVPRGEHRETSALVRSINQRTAELTRMPLSVVADGSIQIARYGVGGHFYPHFDSNPLFQLGAQHLPPGVPNHGRGFGFPYAARYVTLLIFLNTPAEGGNTTFPLVGPNPMHTAKASPSSALGLRDVMGRFGNVNPDALRLWQSHDEHCDGADGCLSIAPKAGDAVLFYNHHVGPDGRLGELDPASFHGGCSVRKGEKWIANYWIEIEPPFCAGCAWKMNSTCGQLRDAKQITT